MQTIKLKRGLDIPFEGQAAETLGSVRRPEVLARCFTTRRLRACSLPRR